MSQINQYNPSNVSLTCPECGNVGTFVGRQNSNDIEVRINKDGKSCLQKSGLRICPNEQCKAIVYYNQKLVDKDKGWEVEQYPRSLIEFDSTDIPDSISSSLKEAITCAANDCNRAAGTMIRRTLEELCHHQSCTGKDLHQRLNDLKTKIIVPDDLLEAAFELKLLGNDAAHIKAKAYDEVGNEEVEIGIELAKELLKAVYQYKGLVAKLKQLKK